MLSTDLEWIILRMLLLTVRRSRTTLDTFRPPPVLPAQAPINISSISITFENSGQASKSAVAKPVEVIIDPTWKDEYLNALEKLFVIEDIEAWCPAIRSATVIRSGKKRGFTDPSIAVAAMGLTPEYLQTDLKTFGFIFECLCIRDLKVYSQALGGKLSYYHDRYDLEADAVLHLDDGRYALIEFKLGSKEIEDGASHLLQLKQLIKKYNEKETQVPLREPDLLMVITGGEMAYTREDGVKIIPIGTLKD
jgi:predicted AAA+ superfamily ATPase